jgi:hypothetical protein
MTPDKLCDWMKEHSISLTPEQIKAYVQLITRRGNEPNVFQYNPRDPYLGCGYPDIFIGIEPDGHIHS